MTPPCLRGNHLTHPLRAAAPSVLEAGSFRQRIGVIERRKELWHGQGVARR